MSAVDAAACCAAFYEQDWVRSIMGEHFHPGGAALSRRLIDDLALTPADWVLDLACGPGTTARWLVDDREVRVTGVDVSAKNLARARALAHGREALRFVEARADVLPFEDGAFDAVMCECAVSTFANKAGVAAEVARVLRPGGRFAISDMAVYGTLPEDIAAMGRGWSCVDDALTFEGYRDLFEDAGLRCVRIDDESPALTEMAVDIKKKLLMAALGELAGVIQGMNADVAELRAMLDRARALVDEGKVRYGRLSFRKEPPRRP